MTAYAFTVRGVFDGDAERAKIMYDELSSYFEWFADEAISVTELTVLPVRSAPENGQQ
jgi:hypothetical protein